MDLLCLDQISILVREQIRIDLSVRIKAERCQNELRSKSNMLFLQTAIKNAVRSRFYRHQTMP